jgi:hypothetical protein
MIDARQRLRLPSGATGTYYSLPQLEDSGIARLSRCRRRRHVAPARRRAPEHLRCRRAVFGGVMPYVLEQLLAQWTNP